MQPPSQADVAWHGHNNAVFLLPFCHEPSRPLEAQCTVAAAVEQDSRFLLVEGHTELGQRLNQPAGHLDPDESLVDAVVGAGFKPQ